MVRSRDQTKFYHKMPLIKTNKTFHLKSKTKESNLSKIIYVINKSHLKFS